MPPDPPTTVYVHGSLKLTNGNPLSRILDPLLCEMETRETIETIPS